VKFLVLRKIFFRKPDFNEPYDGIMYSVVISMGFAGAENLLYVLNNGVEVGVLRMFTAVPAHAGFAILMGYFVGKAKFSLRYKNYYCFIGLFNAILFHGLYDFFLLQQNYAALQYFAFIALIVCLILSFRALNKIRKHLFLKNSSEENSENSNSSLP
jgi:RsiW-degrading membrane proteinase PrsW (M82 family)